jgi:hypothetical protein
MKIIFSRKGFDSSNGRVASPILPSGRLCSLPIPAAEDENAPRYRDILFDGQSLGKLLHDLTGDGTWCDKPAHLDPDINSESIPRLPGWRGAFGQAGAAERHLQNQNVGKGDVFLFYGWFKQVECCNGTYRYIRGAPNLHVVFGWLQIEERIPVAQRSQIPAWACDHAHCRRTRPFALDSLYIAKERLTLPGMVLDIPGAGIFPCYQPSLCLTDQNPYLSRRMWRLPSWTFPTTGRPALTYHRDLKSWERRADYALLKNVSQGQEFVLDCNYYPESIEWLANLIVN